MKPHTSMSATQNAGPTKPGGVPQPVAVGRVGEVGQRHPRDPRHLVRIADRHVPRVVPPRRRPGRRGGSDGGRNSSCSVASTRTPAGSIPASSSASRSAVPTGKSSPGSTPPPGKAGWPAWLRRCADFSISRTSGPVRSLAEEDQHGRPAGRRRRPAASGAAAGGRRPRRSAACRYVGEGHSCTPRCSATSARSSSTESTGPTCV